MARPARLELATLCLEGRRSIQLSYGRVYVDSKRFPVSTTILYPFSVVLSKGVKTVPGTPTLGLLHSDCVLAGHFICLAVHLFECFSLHSQLHLRILFEDLRVALAEQLSDPLVRDAPGTQPRGIG